MSRPWHLVVVTSVVYFILCISVSDARPRYKPRSDTDLDPAWHTAVDLPFMFAEIVNRCLGNGRCNCSICNPVSSSEENDGDKSGTPKNKKKKNKRSEDEDE